MRSFRSNRDNMRDTRLSYLFLLSLAFVCTVTGIVLTHFEHRVSSGEASARYRTLTECADALAVWENAENDGERYTAALRFENAVAALPSQVELDPLFELAESMRSGKADTAKVHALADTFSMLAAVEFADDAEARESIGDTLNGVNSVISNITEAPVSKPVPEVLSYTQKVVEKSVSRIFDGHEGTMEPKLSDNGAAWTVVADNVRMSFDAQTGSLDAFVFLRIGAVPDSVMTQDEIVKAACDFYCANRRRDMDVDAVIADETCGFTVVDITDKGDCWRVCADGHGRIWSLVKVKR